MRPAPDADSQGSRVLQPPMHLVSPRFRPPAPPLPARTPPSPAPLLPRPHDLDATLPTPSSPEARSQRPESSGAKAAHLHLFIEASTKRDLRPRELPSTLSSSLDLHSLHTRLHSLTSFFLLSNPSLCPSTCLPLPPGRATALRTTLQRKVCCNLAGPRAQEECERQAGPAVGTTHRPLCSRYNLLHSRATMTVFAPSVAHLPSGPSPGN